MRALLVLALAAPLVVLAAPPAHAAGCAVPKAVYTEPAPWPQKLVDPTRIWPLTRGAGQVVAIVGTGLDADNPQFGHGRVLGAIDVVGRAGGVADCDGRGTFAAGIVGAQPEDSTTFTGIAPEARLIGVRYTNGEGPGDPNQLATAITRAQQAGAGTILVAVPSTSDSPALRAAVQQVRAAGAVVVSPAAATQAGARSYPTADPGVLAVGAADSAGAAVQTESGDYVALAAPGADLVSTAAGAAGKDGHLWPVKDPTFAAAYVAGTVALLRAYRPAMTPDQITARLTLTASRPPGGGPDPKLGWGLLDAYTAVSSSLPASAPAPGGTPSAAAQPVVQPAAAPGPPARDRLLGGLALAGVVVAVLAGVVTAAVRRGRARGWRPGRLD
ncbi:S8 family serine peptidase [Kutzneria albida]|uniref:S8 family serine peptidase n=1 Tax=Kutzneria albida TaxID=43357 RepID=UPI0005A81632|nr:S8 family serine peptidase [Kutzneria albida]